MYIDENDIRTPRDRGAEELKRLLDAAPAGVRVPCDVCDEPKGRRSSGDAGDKGCDFGKEPSCSCSFGRLGVGHKTRGAYALGELPLAMVYSPIQEWRGIYDEKKGLSRGTIFAELDKPLEGGSCR